MKIRIPRAACAFTLLVMGASPTLHAHPGHPHTPTGIALKTVPGKAQTSVFTVTKMHCESCATGLVQAAKNWPGVKSANVSFAQKRALVTYDPQKTSTTKIEKEFARVGFPAKVVN
jgi:mercuric ion binding protein